MHFVSATNIFIHSANQKDVESNLLTSDVGSASACREYKNYPSTRKFAVSLLSNFNNYIRFEISVPIKIQSAGLLALCIKTRAEFRAYVYSYLQLP